MYSIKKVVLRNFAKFTGKHLSQSLFLNKVTAFRPIIKKQMVVCQIQPGLRFIYFDVQSDEMVVIKCNRLKEPRKLDAYYIIRKIIHNIKYQV